VVTLTVLCDTGCATAEQSHRGSTAGEAHASKAEVRHERGERVVASTTCCAPCRVVTWFALSVDRFAC
jgi:hypothetical protein